MKIPSHARPRNFLSSHLYRVPAYLCRRAVEGSQYLQLVVSHRLVELVESVGIGQAAEAAEAAVGRKAVVPTSLDRVRQQVQIQHWRHT